MDVAIVGIGIHPFGRHEGVSGLAQGAFAVRQALADAGIGWADVQCAFGGSASAGNADSLVSNLGSVSGVLPVPVSRGASCAPVRWWQDGVVLTECSGPGITGPRLWLVPVSGARPAALTPQRGLNGPDYGDINGWRVPGGGLYVQALESCGPPFIARANQNGTVTPLLIPGVVVAQAGQWLLTEQAGGCLGSTSLLWFNPVTHAERWVFRTPAADLGVISAVAFVN